MTESTASAEGLADLVNPLQGTDSDYGFSHGNCLPLVSRPFGMTSWCPQTDEGRWFFHPCHRKLQGIRATHQPSPWIGDYGHFVVMPQVGPRLLGAKARASTFRPNETETRPHYFRTHLGRYQTTLELTPTERCAFLRFTFPAADSARVLMEPFDGESSVQIDPRRGRITGFTRAKSGGAPNNFACYFVAVFDRPLARFATFQSDTIWENETERLGDRVGAFVEFETSAGEVLSLRVATSFISVEQAERNLEREIGERSFESIKHEAEAVWNEHLGRVRIEGATDRQRRTFYSCLYRALLFPRIWYERGADDLPVHYSPYDGQIHEGVLYADNGFWDTYRTVYPLLSLLFPERLTEIINGWVQAFKEGGWFPKWSSPGYRACMIGSHIDAVIADAYVKGVRDFDVEAAYEGLRKHAMEPGDAAGKYGRKGIEDYQTLGYVPADKIKSATSRTLDFAYDDFCIAQIAHALGKSDDHALLLSRAFSYRNVYDTAVGFMRGRNADGSWQAPFSPFAWGDPFVEGGAWQSTWAVAHDPAGLIALMGGKEAFAAKLDQMLALAPHFEVGSYGFEIHEMTEMACADFGQYAHSNQPVHHVLYLFTCAGQPWKTQHWVRRVLNELYSPDPDGFAGDEDNGEMAAWYVLSALGIYPLCPGHPTYVFGSPLFGKATLQLPQGRSLVIEAHNNSLENVYVQQVQLSGETYSKTWVTHDQLVNYGHLTFTMGPQPATGQTFHDEDLPFSLTQNQQGGR